MRRAVVAVAVTVVAVTAFASRRAAASPWSITAEAGVEYDTNVERVEDGTTNDQNQPIDPVAAGVVRLGGRVVRRQRLLGGSLVADASALAREVVISGSNPPGTYADATAASVATLGADARWLRPIGDRPISVGVALTATDVLPLCTDGCIGDLTFSNLGADALVVLHDQDDRHFTLAVGYRDFEYKPAPEFSWSGPTANARLDAVLSHNADHTRTIELAVTAGGDARDYNDVALVLTQCMAGEPAGSVCTASTTFTRRDKFAHVGADLTFVGRQIFSIGYQLGYDDSNSYGQSLIRNRVTASATAELPWHLFGTLLGTLQIDDYPDGLVVLNAANDQVRNLEDESRSSLQLRLARHLNDEWSVELRAAIWRNVGNSDGDEYHRTLISLGVVYAADK
jgi:hypothetical protein